MSAIKSIRQHQVNRESDRMRRFDAAMECLPDTLFELDPDGRIVEFRQGRKPFPVARPGQVLGQHYSDLLPESASRQLAEALMRSHKGEGEQSLQLQVDVDSTSRWFEISIFQPRSSGPGTPSFVIWAREISHRIRQRQELEDQREQLRTLLTAMADGMVLHSRTGRITTCNESAARILGTDQQALLGRTLDELHCRFIREDGAGLNSGDHPTMLSLRDGQAFQGMVLGVDLPSGHRRWISTSTQPLFHAGETRPYAVVTTFSDNTARMNAEHALRHSEERLSLALEGASLGMWDLDLANARFEFNNRSERMLGFEPGQGESRFQFIARMVHPEDREPVRSLLVAHLKGRLQSFDAEFRMRHRDGGYIWVKATGRITDRQGERATRACGTLMDITEWKKLERKLRVLATTDPLTGLYNRRYTMDRLDEALRAGSAGPHPVSLILFDIDHFKSVNDTLGHHAGDRVLKALASQVKTRIRGTDIFSRWGGEEFAVIALEASLTDAVGLAEDIRERVRELPVPGLDRVTASFGVVEHRQGESIQRLLGRADELLYQAKREGRDRVCH